MTCLFYLYKNYFEYHEIRYIIAPYTYGTNPGYYIGTTGRGASKKVYLSAGRHEQFPRNYEIPH